MNGSQHKVLTKIAIPACVCEWVGGWGGQTVAVMLLFNGEVTVTDFADSHTLNAPNTAAGAKASAHT